MPQLRQRHRRPPHRSTAPPSPPALAIGHRARRGPRADLRLHHSGEEWIPAVASWHGFRKRDQAPETGSSGPGGAGRGAADIPVVPLSQSPSIDGIQGVRGSCLLSFTTPCRGALCPMRARGLDGGHRLAAKLQVSRPTRQPVPDPSQGGSAGSNPVGATSREFGITEGLATAADSNTGLEEGSSRGFLGTHHGEPKRFSEEDKR
jgi:hypothetical protein